MPLYGDNKKDINIKSCLRLFKLFLPFDTTFPYSLNQVFKNCSRCWSQYSRLKQEVNSCLRLIITAPVSLGYCFCTFIFSFDNSSWRFWQRVPKFENIICTTNNGTRSPIFKRSPLCIAEPLTPDQRKFNSSVVS